MADAGTGAETPQGETDAPPDEPEESRSVVVGAFRRAFAETESRLLKSYVVVSAVLGGLLALLFLLALPVWVFNTAGGSELATFSRAFLVVGGVLLLVVLVAPVVSAGRRHERAFERARRSASVSRTASARGDFALALSGYLFVLSLYLALLISAPPGQRETPPALVAPAVEFLYGLPPTYAVAPPLLAAALVGIVHRLTR